MLLSSITLLAFVSIWFCSSSLFWCVIWLIVELIETIDNDFRWILFIKNHNIVLYHVTLQKVHNRDAPNSAQPNDYIMIGKNKKHCEIVKQDQVFWAFLCDCNCNSIIDIHLLDFAKFVYCIRSDTASVQQRGSSHVIPDTAKLRSWMNIQCYSWIHE